MGRASSRVLARREGVATDCASHARVGNILGPEAKLARSRRRRDRYSARLFAHLSIADHERFCVAANLFQDAFELLQLL
jgi:hypothetical protein